QAKTKDALMQATEGERKAKSSAAESQAVLKFFQDKVLAAGRPQDEEGGLGTKTTIRQAIDAAEPDIAEAFRDQPAVEASVRNTLGETYRHLGEPTLAAAQHERAFQLRRDNLGLDHADSLDSMNNLALVYIDEGRILEAVAMLEEAFKRTKAR